MEATVKDQRTLCFVINGKARPSRNGSLWEPIPPPASGSSAFHQLLISKSGGASKLVEAEKQLLASIHNLIWLKNNIENWRNVPFLCLLLSFVSLMTNLATGSYQDWEYP
ncbi:hypothetical protein OPQ81_003280 [Rhizoctonia solani]|nr:hypothetical protein OPQ81_003280 [Rhizoctonia solani]